MLSQPRYVAVGGLNVSVPVRLPGHDYPSTLMPSTLMPSTLMPSTLMPSTLMPSNAPNAPYQIPASAVNNYAPNPPVNPSLSTGYALQVCNQTSAAHTITSLSVTIASFTPSNGPVAVWHLCQDGPYDAATKQTTGGCGGSLGGDFLAAALPSDSTGASAPVMANAQLHSGGPPPIVIGPNESMAFLIAVNGLTSQGTYTLNFGVGVDGGAPTQLAPSDGAFLIAPSAVVWTGTACQTSAMQTHIPPSSQDTYYVCPPGA
jgi:hypothetical protein